MSAVPALRLDFAPMRLADIDAVMVAEQRIYSFPWTRGNFTDSLKSGHCACVVRENGALVGYAVMMLAVDEAHLLNLSIVPERRRQGLGSVLLDHLFATARRGGATRMFLEMRPSNVSGQALYRRFGFVTIGERRDYYQAHQGRESAIVMALDL